MNLTSITLYAINVDVLEISKMDFRTYVKQNSIYATSIGFMLQLNAERVINLREKK